ncbi:MAG: enoyl-CoA hydratase-related protein [Novosphingobium sp.]
MAEVLVQTRKARDVGYLILDDAEALNALSPPMAEQFVKAIEVLDRDCRAIVLTGAGKAFCAGARLSKDIQPADSNYDAGAPLEAYFHPMISSVARTKVPVIAAVNGVAAGGGIGLVLGCDLVVVSKTARFIPAFMELGLVPDCGVSQTLVEIIGRFRAAQLLMFGETLSALEAQALGLANYIIDPDDFEGKVDQIAQSVARGPTTAYALTKQLLRAAATDSVLRALERERLAQREAGKTEDHVEGLSAFLERRPPEFTGQ